MRFLHSMLRAALTVTVCLFIIGVASLADLAVVATMGHLGFTDPVVGVAAGLSTVAIGLGLCFYIFDL